MRIVVHSLNEHYGLTLNEIYFLDKCFQLVVQDHPDHEWIFDALAETKGLISLLPLGIKKSLVIKKLDPAVIITQPESKIESRGKYCQLLFWNQYFNSKEKPVLKLPARSFIVTTSEALKKKILISVKVNASQVIIIPSAPADDVSLADWSEKLTIKEKYADGREYFLCFKEIDRHTKWEEILKAFSIFKKWQQSSFKLLIVGRVSPDFRDEFGQKLASYKYRVDVRLLDPVKEDINRILPVAFGLICADEEHTGLNILNAFQAEVPVISSPDDLFDEKVSGAFLPALMSADELSRQLINLYRDEQLREALVEKGRALVANYSWARTTGQWYDCIRNCST